MPVIDMHFAQDTMSSRTEHNTPRMNLSLRITWLTCVMRDQFMFFT